MRSWVRALGLTSALVTAAPADAAELDYFHPLCRALEAEHVDLSAVDRALLDGYPAHARCRLLVDRPPRPQPKLDTDQLRDAPAATQAVVGLALLPMLPGILLADILGDLLGSDRGGPTLSLVPPLHLAASRGQAPSVQRLLRAGAPVDKADESGKLPLAYALQSAMNSGDLAAFDALVQAGAQFDALPPWTATSIHAAARQPAVLRVLVDHGVDLTVATSAGRGALERACLLGELDVARNLLDAGAPAPTPSALLFAAQQTDDALFALLLERGAPLEPDRTGEPSALWLAADRDMPGAIERLAERGANVNHPGGAGETPLHAAAESWRPDAVAVLLRHGADPRLADARGRTALHVAAAHGRAQTTAALLNHGADPAARDSDGLSPLTLAAETEDAALVRLLLDRGAPISPDVVTWLEQRAGSQPFAAVIDELVAAGTPLTEPALSRALSYAEPARFAWLVSNAHDASRRELRFLPKISRIRRADAVVIDSLTAAIRRAPRR